MVMHTNLDQFLEEIHCPEAGTNGVDEQQQQEFNRDREQMLEPIDIEFIKPDGELVEMQFGDGKIEKFSGTSADLAEKIIHNIREGFISPLDFAVKKKLITDALDIAFKNDTVKKMTIEEVQKYGKEATALGAKLSITNRPTYQYSADPVWAQLKASIADVEAKLKAQESKIQAACKNGGSIIDTETGEILASVVPAPSTTSVAVSFKKK